ncbi:MAG: GNAT family N-acetyltransferase [Promethearchaeota archaeon]
MKINRGYSQVIDDQFTLQVATGSSNNIQLLSRILELNILVHGEGVKEYIEDIFVVHPRREDVLWFYIEENSTGKIISCLTMFPLEWKIENLIFPICEMGFVGTLEPYRESGFIGKLNDVYEKAMDERKYVFSVIRGIPYYYRRLGYEFVFPLDDRISFSVEKIPDDELNNLTIRKATCQDMEFINRLYDEFYKQFYVVNKFDKEGFIYRFFKDKYNADRLTTYILEENGQSISYFSIGMSYDNKAYTINVPQLNYPQKIKILQFVKHIHESKNSLDMELHVRHDSEFGKLIFQLGGVALQRYGWQLKIPNLKLFFQSITSIIEQRIQNSIYRDITRNLIISNYRNNIELSLVRGKITKVRQYKGYPNEEECDLRIPGSMLFKLLLGDKSLEEINYIIDDAMVKPSSKMLINIMFPKKVSYPDTYY